MAKKQDNDDSDTRYDYELVKTLYQYDPNIKWLAHYLGQTETEVMNMYGDFISLLDSDRNKAVEFALFYMATNKKDIRAILAWLEVYEPGKYGKVSSELDLQEIKLEILKHLSDKLPG